MRDVVVRLAERSTAAVLADLNLRAAIAGYGHIFPPEAPPPTIDELTEMWSHWLGADWEHGRRAFVAQDGGEVIGVVLSGRDLQEPELGHLARLYVDPARWGQGIGRLLYAAAHQQLHEDGFPAATLWVLEANTKARRWYERLGWQTTGETKVVYEPTAILDLQYRVELSSPSDPG